MRGCQGCNGSGGCCRPLGHLAWAVLLVVIVAKAEESVKLNSTVALHCEGASRILEVRARLGMNGPGYMAAPDEIRLGYSRALKVVLVE